jgi:serine/threonine protein phosphatase PrpC
MKFSIFQASRQGGRKYNQDRVAYSYSRDALLMVVADGMGGHFHGEVAAQIAVQLITESFQKQARPSLADPSAFLGKVVRDAHDAIGAYVVEHGLKESPRTTCVACVVQHNQAYWAHVGDSRLYYFRGGELLTRTRDHSKVQQLFDLGRITQEELSTHPERNKIYNCLGGDLLPDVEVSKTIAMQEGDTLLLCTDGLWGELSEAEIATILDAYPINTAVAELMDHAELRGGSACDNLSAVALRWGDESRLLAPKTISTATMPLEAHTVQLNAFGAKGGHPDVTDEQIEQAIAEIQAAIKKFSK